jgi:AcrR family transcriptional regulator
MTKGHFMQKPAGNPGPPSILRQRARKAHEKEARRQAILGAAARLFQVRGFFPLTLASLAEEAELAKGTIYIYFNTKEEIFLELASTGLLGWFEDLDEGLRGSGGGLFPEPLSPEDLAGLLVGTLEAQALLPPLLALVPTVLEPAVDRLAALRFREFLADRCLRTGRLLELRLPTLGEGEGTGLVLRLLAQVLGLWPLSNALPGAPGPAEGPGLEVFGVPFRQRLQETCGLLLAGVEACGPSRG